LLVDGSATDHGSVAGVSPSLGQVEGGAWSEVPEEEAAEERTVPERPVEVAAALWAEKLAAGGGLAARGRDREGGRGRPPPRGAGDAPRGAARGGGRKGEMDGPCN